MTNPFQKATKRQARLRMALIGPAGSGKTYSALAIAKGLGGRVALIDTERGSASKYAREFDFDVLELESHAPERYIDAIRAAEAAGYDVLIIDSLSHAWAGRDGILEFVDKQKSTDRNQWTGPWGKATPKHNALVDAILGCRAHVIATMRSKMEFVLQKDERGREVPTRVGMQPIQRDGLEYEFDVVGDLDQANRFTVSKTRCSALRGAVIDQPGAGLARTLADWLSDGAPMLDRDTGELMHAEGAPPAPSENEAGAAADYPPAAPSLPDDSDQSGIVEWANDLLAEAARVGVTTAHLSKVMGAQFKPTHALAYCRINGVTAEKLVSLAADAKSAA